MTISLRLRLIVAFVLVFLAGAFCDHLLLFSRMADRMYLGQPHSGSVAKFMREHLRRELDLTPQQFEQLAPIIDNTAAKLDSIRIDATNKADALIAEQHRQFALLLKPEQVQKLEALERLHRHRLERHGLHSPLPSPEQSP
jgi:hypothetical protein